MLNIGHFLPVPYTKKELTNLPKESIIYNMNTDTLEIEKKELSPEEIKALKSRSN